MSDSGRGRQRWSEERSVPANGVDLCVQTIGDPNDPAVLLIGTTMLTWDDGFCERVAVGGRYVIRYDLRDTGRSTAGDPDAPQYTLRDLVDDATGLLDALGLPRAHIVGFGCGGWIAQLMALDHGDHIASLTLIASRATAPGPSDADLPEHAPVVMAHLMSAPQPDWSDRDSVVAAALDRAHRVAGSGAFDEVEARRHIGRVADRTIAALTTHADAGERHRADQMATMFAALDSKPRWRERLGEITAPTLVIHGADDPFFPLGNGEALAAEIHGAELLVLPETGQELPGRVWDVVVDALVRHTQR